MREFLSCLDCGTSAIPQYLFWFHEVLSHVFSPRVSWVCRQAYKSVFSAPGNCICLPQLSAWRSALSANQIWLPIGKGRECKLNYPTALVRDFSDGIFSCSFRSGLARLSLACNSFEGFSQKGKMALTTGLAAKLGFMRVKESSNLSTTWLKLSFRGRESLQIGGLHGMVMERTAVRRSSLASRSSRNKIVGLAIQIPLMQLVFLSAKPDSRVVGAACQESGSPAS